MPTVWRLRSEHISQEELDRFIKALKPFPIGTLDNCDPDFVHRCKFSTTHEGCIVFCMANGMEPDIYEQQEMTSDVRPTFKGVPPKKIAFLGKNPGQPLLPGQIVVQTCNFQYCVNQQHLEDGGRTRNQYTG